MNAEDIIFHYPPGPPGQLILLYHSLGSDAYSMAPVGRTLAAAFHGALIASVAAPLASEAGSGAQWISLKGISEGNRIARIAAELPYVIDNVRAWQRESGLGSAETILLGFSQGAMVSLEAVKAAPGLAGHIVSINGRFAELPVRPLSATFVHLLHGMADPVIHYSHSIYAEERLTSIGSATRLDMLPDVGYAIDDRMVNLALKVLCPSQADANGHSARRSYNRYP